MERFYRILAYFFGGLVLFFSAGCITQGQVPPGVLLIIIILIILSTLFNKMSHRLQRKEKNINITDVKPPFVLYLRSFLADETTRKTVYFLTGENNEEESLVTVLGQIAPVYAIGDPKDEMMPLGALRVYVDEEHWKGTVKALAQKAEVVVLRLGKTDSFLWEVEMVLKEVPLHKLLFAIPATVSLGDVSALKNLLEKKIDFSNLDISVKRAKMGSLSRFLYFDVDGQPYINTVESPRVKIANAYEEVLQKSLDGFFDIFFSSNTNLNNQSANTLGLKSKNNTIDDDKNYNSSTSSGSTVNDDAELIARLSSQAREQIEKQQADDPDITDKLIKKAEEVQEVISTAKEVISESDAYNKAKEEIKNAGKSLSDKALEIKDRIDHSDAVHQAKAKAKDMALLIADKVKELVEEIKKKI